MTLVSQAVAAMALRVSALILDRDFSVRSRRCCLDQWRLITCPPRLLPPCHQDQPSPDYRYWNSKHKRLLQLGSLVVVTQSSPARHFAADGRNRLQESSGILTILALRAGRRRQLVPPCRLSQQCLRRPVVMARQSRFLHCEVCETKAC